MVVTGFAVTANMGVSVSIASCGSMYRLYTASETKSSNAHSLILYCIRCRQVLTISSIFSLSLKSSWTVLGEYILSSRPSVSQEKFPLPLSKRPSRGAP